MQKRKSQKVPGRSAPLIEWALYYHRKGINVIRAYYKGKCPPKGGEWERYRTERVPEAQCYEWFGPGTPYSNMSAITGPVSNGLTVLDFDSEEAYKRWQENNPDLAMMLPTSKSGRGYHVFLRSDLTKDDASSFAGVHVKAGGLVSLPPSMHKSGVRYEWIIPLPEKVSDLPLLNPYEMKLDQYTDVTEQLEQTEQAQQLEQTEQKEAICEEKKVIAIDEFVKRAISENLPKKQGMRNRCIFEFARSLQADPRFADAGASQLRPIFKLWFDRALPIIGTKDFDTSWFDFLNAWERVILPKGVEMTQILERAKTTPVPEFAREYQNPKRRLLVCWCKELQSEAGDKPFWLSARTAAKYLEVKPMTAWRYLFILVREKVLEEVEKGKMTRSGGVATRYRYVAG